jgi:mono/diheme cytochrome c family protein
VAGGQQLWAENCQPCHGLTGRGDGPTAEAIPDPLPNFADPETARQFVPAANFDVIKNGRMDKMMPPWGERLTDEEMWNAASYVWRLGVLPQNLAAGETLYAEQCAACHGPTGAGDGPDASASINDFTDLAVMVQKSQADLQTGYAAGDTHANLSGLSADELWQTLDYVRAFSFEVTIPRFDGVLTGQVINATTGQPAGNVAVTLHVVQNNAEIDTRTATADAQGNYRFEKLSTEHAVLYMLEGVYGDIAYVSDEPGIFTPDSKETALNLNVYDTTTSAADVSISQLHYLLSFSPGAANIVQIFVVGNRGNQTYVGQNGQTLAVPLPAGAVDVTFQNNPASLRFEQVDGGYVDTEPVVPGPEGSSVVALYSLPFDGDSLTVDLPSAVDIEAVNILMSSQGAELTSAQVQFAETRSMQGSEFAIFNGGKISQGQNLAFTLSNLDNLVFDTPDAAAAPPGATAGGPPVDQAMLRWIVVGLGALAIVAAGAGYPLWRGRLAGEPAQADDPTLQRQKLVLFLARLDDAFEAGELTEPVYRQARVRAKAQLVQWWQS